MTQFMATGAMPPPEFAWQIGKTAASIKFVNDATRYIMTCPDPAVVGTLTDAINKIKSGEVILTQFTTPMEHLAQSKQP